MKGAAPEAPCLSGDKHKYGAARFTVLPCTAIEGKALTGGMECDNMKRGEIYRADLDPVIGSEQGGIRPVLIIQNDIGNLHSPTVIVAAITSRLNKPKLPTHVAISSQQSGLKKDSVILAEQVRTLEKKRLMEKLGRVDEEVMMKVDRALAISLGASDKPSAN
jgi:mRNA interferase MazF